MPDTECLVISGRRKSKWPNRVDASGGERATVLVRLCASIPRITGTSWLGERWAISS
jgi:hypothetical protein